jgi:hypothetical protein
MTINNFITENHFQTINASPTKTIQNQIIMSINHRTTLMPQDSKWKYLNLNPSAPIIKGLTTIHIPTQPIRPIVNWRNPQYTNYQNYLHKKINQPIPLPYTFNMQNSTKLIQALK